MSTKSRRPRFKIKCTPTTAVEAPKRADTGTRPQQTSKLAPQQTSKLAPQLYQPPKRTTIRLGEGVRVTPCLHLARAAPQGPHYFIPIECITAQEQQKLKSLPKKAHLTTTKKKPRGPAPQADITGILGSCLSTQPPTVDKQDVSIKKPAVQHPGPPPDVGKDTYSNKRNGDAEIIKMFEKRRRLNKAKRVQHFVTPLATSSPPLRTISEPSTKRKPLEGLDYVERDGTTFLYVITVRLRPSRKSRAQPTQCIEPLPTHHPSARLPSKAVRTFFKSSCPMPHMPAIRA